MIMRAFVLFAMLTWPALASAQQPVLTVREQQVLKSLFGSSGFIEQLLVKETATHPLGDAGFARIMVDSASHTLICSFNGAAYVPCLGGGGSFSLNGLFGSTTLLGTPNQVGVVTGLSTVTLSTPQDISTSSNVTFNDLKLLSQIGADGCAKFVGATGQVVNTLIPCGVSSPGGATTQVQINDAGSFYADSGFVYNKTLKVVTTAVRDKGIAGGQVFNVKAYGAVCDGTTNDTAILQSVVNSMSAITGSTMFVPPDAVCAVHSPGLDLTGLNNAQTIEGPSSARVGIPAKLLFKATATALTGNTTNTSAVVTNIVPNTTGLVAGWSFSGLGIPASSYILSVDGATQVTMTANATATAAGVAIKSSPSLLFGKPSGLTLRRLGLVYDQVGYTGTLLNLAGSVALPTSRIVIEHNYIGGLGSAFGAAVLLDVRDGYDFTIKENTWGGGARYIQGAESAADFNNRITVVGNHFGNTATDIYIRAGGQAWTIDQNTVEPMRAAAPPYDVPPLTQVGFVQVTPAGMLGSHYGTNWLGVEGGSTTGTYFVGGTVGLTGGVFAGNAQIGFAGGISSWNLGASKGLLITDYLPATSNINFGTSSDIVWFGSQCATITGRPTGVSLWSDCNRFNASAPLWVDAGVLDGIPFRGFGRPSDDAASIVFYRQDRTTQTGFFQGGLTGFGFGGSGGYLLFAQNSGNIGIGTNVASAPTTLTVSRNADVLPAPNTGAALQVAAVTGTQSSILVDGFNEQGAFVVRRANGTPVARTALLLNQSMGALIGTGAYNPTDYSNSQASWGMFAAEDFTGTNRGTYLTAGCTPIGTTILTECLRVAGISGGFRTSMSPMNTGPSYANSRPLYMNPTTSGTRTTLVAPTTYDDVLQALSYPGIYILNTDSSTSAGSNLGLRQDVAGLIGTVESSGYDGAGTGLAGVYYVKGTASGGGTQERVATSGSIFATSNAAHSSYGVNGFAGVVSTATSFALAVSGLFEINCQPANCSTRASGVQIQNINNALFTTVTSDTAVKVILSTGTTEAWIDAFRASTDGTVANSRARILADGRLYLAPTAAFVDAFSINAPAASNGAVIRLNEVGSQLKFLRNKGGNFEILDGGFANVRFSIGDAGTIITNGSTGVSCGPGTPTAGFTTVNGIVTAC